MHLQVVTNRMHLTLPLTQVVTNRMHGYLRMRIAQFLTTIHTTPHVIYLTRHGQSEYARWLQSVAQAPACPAPVPQLAAMASRSTPAGQTCLACLARAPVAGVVAPSFLEPRESASHDICLTRHGQSEYGRTVESSPACPARVPLAWLRHSSPSWPPEAGSIESWLRYLHALLNTSVPTLSSQLSPYVLWLY